jgi:hypothetical protein
MWNSWVQAAEVSQRRTAVSSKCFQLYYACSDSWPSRSTLALSSFFPLLLWRFLSAQLFCVHCTAHLHSLQNCHSRQTVTDGRTQPCLSRRVCNGSLEMEISGCSCWSCRWGEAVSLNCGNQRAYCSSPDDIWVQSHGGLILTKEKPKNSGEKPVPMPLCPPQVPHGLTHARTRASAVRGRRLTTWAMARINPEIGPRFFYYGSNRLFDWCMADRMLCCDMRVHTFAGG